jgi:exodeoxyribonuclease VII small subunit
MGVEDISTLALEKVLERLNGVVDKLERGDLPLEQALTMFEEGVHLAREGQRRLDAAEARIEALVQGANGDGQVVIQPIQQGQTPPVTR